MAKKRVYEFAKENEMSSKDVISNAKKLGIDYGSHMSSMEPDEVSKLQKQVSEPKGKKSDNIVDKVKEKVENVKETVKESIKETTSSSEEKKTTNQKQESTEKKVTQTQKSKPAASTPSPAQSGRGNRPVKRGRRGNRRGKQKNLRSTVPATPRKFRELPETLVYTDGMTVAELAKKIHREPAEIVKKLFMMGIVATQNQSLDKTAIELLADDYGMATEEKVQVDISDLSIYFEEEEKGENLETRPATVTIMGHVDHGKTTLLDTLRNTRVSEGEAGGITQHIGAYQVEEDGKLITFLDTPGHAAFTTMRARGADVTDIAIIVVAADDGVMPQTVEAVNHAKAAEVPIIVAVNKIDKPTANPDKVMQELSEYGLIPEAWGGETIFVPISAKFGENLDELLEMILLVAEVEELKANPSKRAVGTVVEARLDKSKGPIATLLVQGGTLHVGDPIVVGHTFGRVRVMLNDKGRRVKSALPSAPVEITGLNETPQAGDKFVVFEDEKTARQVGEERAGEAAIAQRSSANKITLDNLFESLQEGEIKAVNLIIKTDVQGSAEALGASLEKIDVEGVRVDIVHSGVGAINESDVSLANASNAIIIGFNVRPTPQAKEMADRDDINIRLHRIIYTAIDEIEAAMKGLLDPEYEEKVIGTATVRETYAVSKVGTIAGCFVSEGRITRKAGIRLIRNNVVIYEGELTSLKRFKDDAKEVAKGFECGLTIKDYNDIKVDDVIEAYEMVEVK